MNSDIQSRDQSLRPTFDKFVQACFHNYPVSGILPHLAKNVMGYGTTVDERRFNVEGFLELLKSQENSAGSVIHKYDRNLVFERKFSDENSALFVEEIQLVVRSGEMDFDIFLRISVVLEYIGGIWQIVHWHASTPVMTENDTWHIKDIQGRTEKLERLVEERTEELQNTIKKLKATQEQLIVQEKLASLGQLAAGIAHEIKNPMNFVNNFSELSIEYVDEIRTELDKVPASDSTTEISNLLDELESNLKKIHQHGTRADNIVKSMLMHSRGGTGAMEPTNLNELLAEYVNLAFHGMRAGKTAINCKITLDLDSNLPMVALNTEDFSRVVLNLCKNAFDAMREKTLTQAQPNYLPELTVSTKYNGDSVWLSIQDNGPGVADNIRKKLFEPFFTTKKGTEGTGLGLSITNDIIKAHAGKIDLDSSPGEGTKFTITIPVKQSKQP